MRVCGPEYKHAHCILNEKYSWMTGILQRLDFNPTGKVG